VDKLIHTHGKLVPILYNNNNNNQDDNNRIGMHKGRQEEISKPALTATAKIHIIGTPVKQLML
jgi:hypothetical protein